MPNPERKNSGCLVMWIYIDVFRQHHRAGYARLYNPIVDDGQQNTLHFVIQKDYNYDRERDRSEGDDWGEPPK